MTLTLTEDVFGSSMDPITERLLPVRRFSFSNECDMLVQVITLGATITSIQVPDKRGNVDDVVMGYDEIEHYLNGKRNPYFGATIGRVANRIGNGRFTIDGLDWYVSKNFRDKHTLHGGVIGFNMAHWTVEEVDKQNCVLVLQHVSRDLHEGFPGTVTARARFQLAAENRFSIKYTATTTRPTPVNMTNHSYFNLAGHGAGRGAIYDHLIAINANKITVTDEDVIPTGEFLEVKDTPFDFRELKELGQQMMKMSGRGYDHNYCVHVHKNKTSAVARAVHVESGRYLELSSDQPGLQFYTSNFLPDSAFNEHPFPGKKGANYYRQGAFCFEPQAYPDAVNHSNFPNIILRPGKTYEHNIVYHFGITYHFENNKWLQKF